MIDIKFGIWTVLLLAAGNASALAGNSLQVLLVKEATLNDKCRGGSGDDPSTQKACDDREKIDIQLKQAGWCWGEPEQIEADKTWHRCGSKTQGNSVNYDPQQAIHAEQLREQISGTAQCMQNADTAYLQQGIRDRSTLEKLSVQLCRSSLQWFMSDVLKHPQREIDDLFEKMAKQELEEVEDQSR